MYHPLYNRFRPRGVGTSDDPLDLTWIFFPHGGVEWFIPTSYVDDKPARIQDSTKDKKVHFTAENPFDVANMKAKNQVITTRTWTNG